MRGLNSLHLTRAEDNMFSLTYPLISIQPRLWQLDRCHRYNSAREPTARTTSIVHLINYKIHNFWLGMLSFESQIISVRHRMRWRDNHLIHKSNCLTYLTLGKAGVPCNSAIDVIHIDRNSQVVLTGWGDVTVSSFTHCRFVDFIELRFKIRFPGLSVCEDRKPLRSTFDVSIYSIGVGMGDTSLHHSGTHAKFIVKSFKVRQQLLCVSIAVRCQVVESAWHHSYNIFSRIFFLLQPAVRDV